MSKLSLENKWVIITGASSGIGLVFAQELASRGANLILVARSEDKLNSLAQSLREKYQVQIDVTRCDLSKPNSPRALYDVVQKNGRQIYGLINNAGFAVYGRFHESSIERNQEEILLNVHALAMLTQLFITQMVARNEGMIINVASTAAFQPIPYMVNYGATKAFVLSFTEALWGEYQDTGVRILALCPGSTETPFFDVVNAKEASVGKRDSPQNVVTQALKALEKNRSYIITGPISNYLLAQLGRILPRAAVVKTTKNVMKPKTK